MTDFSRREMLGFLGLAVMSGAFGCTSDGVERAARKARETAHGPFTPEFFTEPELRTVRLLADIVIPKDERSGSAGDAKVAEFMDHIMVAYPSSGEQMRKGLAWLDAESTRRHQKPFADLAEAERIAIVDAIAWPKKAAAEMKEGVDFFNNFRNLTATGFWSSRIGVEDLRYIGNVFNPNWSGCPAEQMQKLGVSYS
jgi:hypothetical protein